VTPKRLLLLVVLLNVAHQLNGACTNPTLQQLTSISTGSYAPNFAVGDLDRDGRIDMAVPSAVTDDVRIHFGNGDGTFDPYVSYPVTDAGMLLIRDVNNDQWPDIVVNHLDSKLGVLLNAGNGTFGAVQSVEIGVHLVASMVSADVNGDNYADIVIGDLGSFTDNPDVHVLFNNGSGAFTEFDNWLIAGNVTDVALGDFNNDSRPDVAVVYGPYSGNGAGTLAIYLNANNGSFPIAANSSYVLDTAGTNSSWAIAVADFDKDGDPDLGVSEWDSFDAFLNNSDGTFTLGDSEFIAPGDIVGVAAEDFNEDNVKDLVFASLNGSDIIFEVAAGNGTFTTLRYTSTSAHISKVVGTDFDGDGRPDLLLLDNFSNQIRVFRNVCSSRYSTVTIESVSNATYPQNVDILVRVTPRGGTIVPTGNVTLSDNGNPVETKALSAAAAPTASVTFTLTKPAVGTHSLVATYLGDGNFGTATSAPSSLIIVRPPFGAPLDVVATGNVAFARNTITWVGSNGASSYDVMRMNGGIWTVIANTAAETYDDFAIQNNKPYVYAVRAHSGSDELSALSNADVANIFTYTSSPLTIGATVKAVDINELRSMVNNLRLAVGLTTASFTDPSLTAGTIIKRAHITELRSALETALAVVSIAPPAYNQPSITVGATIVKKTDQQEIRNGMN